MENGTNSSKCYLVNNNKKKKKDKIYSRQVAVSFSIIRVKHINTYTQDLFTSVGMLYC